MTAMLWGLLAGAILSLLYGFIEKRKDKEADRIFEKVNTRRLDQLISNRKERTACEATEASEFWELISSSKLTSKGNFDHQKGLLRDRLQHFEADELVKLDNFYMGLLQQAFTYKLYVASMLIFGRAVEIQGFLNFIDWSICQGEAAFNNICHNADILAYQDVWAGNEDDYSIGDILREVYYSKTNTLMPENADHEFALQGEELTEEEIAETFPKLWKSAGISSSGNID